MQSTPYLGGKVVQRKQRYPQYSRAEMELFFSEVKAGYCWKEATDRCKYVRKWVNNTLNSHDDLMDRLLDSAITAGYRIREGTQKAPKRRDGLYDAYRQA